MTTSSQYVGPEGDALVFTGSHGGPMFRATFSQQVWRPAAKKARRSDVTVPTLRQDRLDNLLGAGVMRP